MWLSMKSQSQSVSQSVSLVTCEDAPKSNTRGAMQVPTSRAEVLWKAAFSYFVPLAKDALAIYNTGGNLPLLPRPQFYAE